MADDSADDLDLLQGTLHVLILKTLAWGPRHGYAVARRVHDVSDDVLRIEEGARRSAAVGKVPAGGQA